MLVKEKINNMNDNYNFIVTENGKILMIGHKEKFTFSGKYTEEKILNMEVKQVRLLSGVINDIVAIRV